ncbi:MAG: hypothetical protein MJA32_04930 [Proteobacteria bacterium]|nr:hypothetical protein [Pseudomonadota bacterium]
MTNFRPSLVLVCVCAVSCGCATPDAVDHAAVAAAAKLDELQSELSAIVRDHNAYLGEAAKLANEEIDSLRSVDIDEFFSRNADAYLASLRGASVATVESTLPGFAQSTLTAWQAREAARQALRDRLEAMQEQAADEVAVNFRKVRALRGKLNVLAAPRAGDDALKFVVAYLQEVDRELDKLEEEDNDN